MNPAASAAECIHGLTLQTCTVCKHGPRHPRVSGTNTAFNARYDGWCGVCESSFEVGDEILRTEDGYYIHADCEAQ